MPKKDTQFSSTNQPKGRGKSKKSLMLEAIRNICDDEISFLEQCVKIGLGGWTEPEQEEGEEKQDPIFQPPNPMLLNLVLNRIEPPLKATSPLIEFDFDEKLKPHEQAGQIMKGVSTGEVPPDIGQMFVASIKSMIEIEEYTDLKDRIEKIEKSLGVVGD